MAKEKVHLSVDMITRGKRPHREYFASLRIGSQGFEVAPRYFEGVDEEAEQSARAMTRMLAHAMRKVVNGKVVTEAGKIMGARNE